MPLYLEGELGAEASAFFCVTRSVGRNLENNLVENISREIVFYFKENTYLCD